MHRFSFAALIAIAILVLTPGSRATDSVNVYQLVVTGMSVPGIGGTFTNFSAPTTDRDVDDDTGQNPFWFIATSSNGNSGVFVYDAYFNQLFDLADTTMTAPTGGNFASFSNLSSGEGAVGFIATDTNGIQGVYSIGDAPLTLIVTPSTTNAIGVAIGDIRNISITGDPYGNPAGVIETDSGIYEFIAGSPAPLLGNANNPSLTSVGPASFKGSFGNSNLPGIALQAYAFAADAGAVRSIYYNGAGSGVGEKAVASIGGSTPNSLGTFTSFGNPVVTANEVSFTAHYSNASGDQQGIFIFGGYLGPIINAGADPTLRQVVATGQIAPNSGGATFTGFSDLSDSSFDQIFIASLSNGGEGLYVNIEEGTTSSPGPQLIKVVATGDTINGKTILGFALSPDASNLQEISTPPFGTPDEGTGFEVNFTDGSEALEYFTINLPEPASLTILAFPILLIRRLRRPQY